MLDRRVHICRQIINRKEVEKKMTLTNWFITLLKVKEMKIYWRKGSKLAGNDKNLFLFLGFTLTTRSVPFFFWKIQTIWAGLDKNQRITLKDLEMKETSFRFKKPLLLSFDFRAASIYARYGWLLFY